MRHAGGLLLIIVVAAACTPEGAEPPPDVVASEVSSVEPTSDASASVTPSPELTLEPTQTCDGLGKPPRRAEITFISEGKLMGASPDGTSQRCLAHLADLDVGDFGPVTSWNAPSDRVLIESQVLSSDLSATSELAIGASPVWSRPTGTSVVWIDDEGHLMKRSSFGGRATDISFLARHDDVTYHPAGTHVATSGRRENGDYGLFLATNIGTEPKLIARGEKARFITNLEFSEDGQRLYYTARHGPGNWHLHRLLMGSNPVLETLAKKETDFDYSVAWFTWMYYAAFSGGDCAAGQPGELKIDGPKMQIPDELQRSNLRPVGWLSGSRLVVTSSPVSCSTAAPQDIYVLRSKGSPVLIAEEVGASVAIRQKMPPPPPPPGEEQEVVA